MCSMKGYAAFVFGAGIGGPSNHSPSAQIPADQTSSSELMQKKLIVCPISSHEPVSVTFIKNVIVMTVDIQAL